MAAAYAAASDGLIRGEPGGFEPTTKGLKSRALPLNYRPARDRITFGSGLSDATGTGCVAVPRARRCGMADSWVPVAVAIVAAVFGFIGVIIGGVVTGWFTVRAERVRADKAVAFDSAKRRHERLLERDNFQRATLLGLQDVAGGLVTLAAQVHADDSASFAKTGKWPIGPSRAEAHPRPSRHPADPAEAPVEGVRRGDPRARRDDAGIRCGGQCRPPTRSPPDGRWPTPRHPSGG